MDEQMAAKGLVNAMISYHVDAMWIGDTPEKRAFTAGRWDMLLHAVEVAHGLDTDAAMEWLAEECQERYVAKAD